HHGGDERALADQLDVDPGYEAALAAALGGRLGAAVVADLAAGSTLLDRSGADGGSALVSGGALDAGVAGDPPLPEAERLIEHVRGSHELMALVRSLLADTWVVPDLAALPAGFAGTAVTRGGRAWLGAWRELRQIAEGGEERVLAERNRRDELSAGSEAAVAAQRETADALERAIAAVGAADAQREYADRSLRAAARERDETAERERRAGWLIEQRRGAPDEGPSALRRAQVEGALAAERRVADRAERARQDRATEIDEQRRALLRDESLAPAARELAASLKEVAVELAARASALDAELTGDRAGGEEVAAELRACAQREAELQAELRERGDAVTGTEVAAQQARDQAAEIDAELRELAARLELAAEPAEQALDDQERASLQQRIERLARRRELLGPVNPLAKDEYAEAREYVEELERQRHDLEAALRELEGLITETDRRIREAFESTFAAAAKNFEEVVEQLFPGGRGQLRLVREDAGPRPVLGGQPLNGDGSDTDADDDDAAAEPEEDRLGVEIEMTPAGKAMKRLSLLSGGEKSLTALAFLFAVFLARPCPFYVLDEVEAALDDLNIDRFLTLLRRYSQRAQFIVVTHQKRTMEAADTLYGVSMGDDGVSKVISRRLPREEPADAAAPAA
ncbi:MAG: chromosome segregation protein, partial [Solirubrobacteraceae bacterium]|nr:chromosome segregation protein [Solirubrobacteraceae bacterium]